MQVTNTHSNWHRCLCGFLCFCWVTAAALALPHRLQQEKQRSIKPSAWLLLNVSGQRDINPATHSYLNGVSYTADKHQPLELRDGKSDEENHLLHQHHCLPVSQRAVIVQIGPASGSLRLLTCFFVCFGTGVKFWWFPLVLHHLVCSLISQKSPVS